jgi:capsid protein
MVSILVDRYGKPMPANGHKRSASASLHAQFRPKAGGDGRPVEASYDAAQTTPTSANYWPGQDHFDADRSNTPAARKTTRERARYEVANDSLAKGIVLTLANHEIGGGPALQVLTQNDGFNAMVQARWNEWCVATDFAEKLHTMVQARIVDGECFALMGTNDRLDHAVKLDVRLLECDQVATPFLPYAVPNRIDGLWFYAWGNATFYAVLRWHPGGVFPYWTWLYDTVPAQYVLHLKRTDRPNQHRGLSELGPALRLFAQRRRFLEAVVKAAETGANLAILLKTPLPAGVEAATDPVTIGAADIPQNMVAALPYGYDALGFKAEQPATTFEMFDRRLILNIARVLNMPYAIAACDSSQSNFSSGRLDHQTYFAMVRVMQARAAKICSRVFAAWFQEACRVFAWKVPASPAPAHVWNFVEAEYSDPEVQANAVGTGLATGTTSFSRILNSQGIGVAALHKKAAEELGFETVEQYKAWVRANLAAKFGGNVRNAIGELEQLAPSPEAAAPIVRAMADVLDQADPSARRSIFRWAMTALLKPFHTAA